MKNDSKEKIVLIRSGNHSMFASVKKDETVLLGDPSTFVYAGVTIKEEKREKDAVKLIKKLNRRIKKK